MSAMMLILAQTAMFAPIYHMFTVLNFLQFPWRLGLFLAVLALPLVGIIWTQLSRSLKIVGIVLLIWQAIVGSKLQPVDFFHKNIVDYDAFTQTTASGAG
jgi:FtsH-binding integral membrane protein